MQEAELQAHAAWDRGELRTALRLFTSAANTGRKNCALNVGYFYDEGLGVPRSKSTALRWYARSHHEGASSGATNAAIVHRERGQYRAMFKWFRRACRQEDDGDAELDLAKCILAGKTVVRAKQSALKHLRRAIRSDSITPAGAEEARALYRRLTGCRPGRLRPFSAAAG